MLPLGTDWATISSLATAEGGRGVAEHVDGRTYLALSLRNVGSGIGVCQGWAVRAGQLTSRTAPNHTPEDSWFASLNRHWHLDAPGPRDEQAAIARARDILHEQGVSDEEIGSVVGRL